MRRVYTEVANSYAPFTQAVLQGVSGSLGADKTDRNGWPAGRSYVGIAHFRAPYDEFSYFQDNTLSGLGTNATLKCGPFVQTLGAVASSEMDAMSAEAPGAVKRFLLSGEPVSPLRNNVTLPFNQVHPYVYGGIALAALVTSYYSYKTWKKTHPTR
jgi:hypothetical protein